MISYLDSDYGGDMDDDKSTYGYAFHIFWTMFVWSSNKHHGLWYTYSREANITWAIQIVIMVEIRIIVKVFISI